MTQKVEMIETYHEEMIHDISFDHYGTRFATCSSDQSVKIYGKNSKGQFVRQAEIKCHDGPIWRVKWAHPQFGIVIATCSQDKSVCLWEEKKFIDEDPNNPNGYTTVRSQWVQRNKIIETKESVQDIKFGNRKIGLLVLAIAFADGNLQIYRMLEQQNLSQLLNVGEVMANPYGIRSISWNKSFFEPEMIAVGGNNQENSFSKGTDHLLSPDLRPGVQRRLVVQQPGINCQQNVEKGPQNTLTIYGKEDKGQNDQTYSWVSLHKFDQVDTVNDVSWANQNGRNFHLLAAADCNGIKVWKFTVKDKNIDILQQMNIDQTPQEAWRVSWNILATVFAASYKKQEVRVFKNMNNNWVCQGSLTEDHELQQESQEA